MQVTAPRFLIVTDQYNYGRLLEHHLSTVWQDVEIKVHEPNHSGRFHAGFVAAGFDCVLLDHEVEGGSGLEWMADLRERVGFPPVLYFASSSSGTPAAMLGDSAVQAGAADWFARERVRKPGSSIALVR